jgi:hypothetical protein
MTRTLSLLSIGIVLSCSRTVEQHQPHGSFASEVVYHVFQRSFYDSDGDQHGDLRGLTSKLDYLEDLGVTTVLMVPIYPSIYYHNYFPTTFEGVDQEYGSLDDYAQLVSALHERGMKLIMDMEIHYVTEQHAWWDSYGNPESEYSDYIIFNGAENTDPESMIFGLTEMTSYTGEKLKVATANMLDEKVKAYHTDLFTYWMDPNGDGDFSDGVDGFRIDHMMDDLDWKGVISWQGRCGLRLSDQSGHPQQRQGGHRNCGQGDAEPNARRQLPAAVSRKPRYRPLRLPRGGRPGTPALRGGPAGAPVRRSEPVLRPGDRDAG